MCTLAVDLLSLVCVLYMQVYQSKIWFDSGGVALSFIEYKSEFTIREIIIHCALCSTCLDLSSHATVISLDQGTCIHWTIAARTTDIEGLHELITLRIVHQRFPTEEVPTGALLHVTADSPHEI